MIHPNNMWNTAWWKGSNSCALLGVKKEEFQVPRSSVAPIAHVYSIPCTASQEVLLEDLYEHTSASIAMKSFVVLLSLVVCGSSMQWIKDVISTSVIQPFWHRESGSTNDQWWMFLQKKTHTLRCFRQLYPKWFLSQPCDGTCGGASQWLDFQKQTILQQNHPPTS